MVISDNGRTKVDIYPPWAEQYLIRSPVDSAVVVADILLLN